MGLVGAASAVASRVKGADYRIDPRVSSTYLLSVVTGRAVMVTRGSIRLRRWSGPPFVGSRVRLRATDQLRLGRGVTISDGCYIDALSERGVTLGDGTSLGKNSRIECTGSLKNVGVGFEAGQNVGLGADCFYGAAGGIEIGADTIIGNFVSFHSENHVASRLDVPIRLQGVTRVGIVVGPDCWIGAKATLLDGVRLGGGSIVAAGCVMPAGDYPPHGVYGGVPARRLGTRSPGDDDAGG